MSLSQGRSKFTQETGHVNRILQWYPAGAIRKHIASVAMDYTIDGRESLVNLTMNVSLQIPGLCIFLDRFSAVNVVLDQIFWCANQRWWHVAWHPECCWVIRRAHRNVPICVNKAMVVEDVACCD